MGEKDINKVFKGERKIYPRELSLKGKVEWEMNLHKKGRPQYDMSWWAGNMSMEDAALDNESAFSIAANATGKLRATNLR